MVYTHFSTYTIVKKYGKTVIVRRDTTAAAECVGKTADTNRDRGYGLLSICFYQFETAFCGFAVLHIAAITVLRSPSNSRTKTRSRSRGR